MRLKPRAETTQIEITGLKQIGNLLLWLPEAIMSNTGASSVYPVGGEWINDTGRLVQEVSPECLFGPGNCARIGDDTLELAGIRFPVDQPVAWNTALSVVGRCVEFVIHLTNLGSLPIEKAGAAICLRFLDAGWWSDERAFVLSGGGIRSLAELGRGAGLPNGFQAYLVEGESFDHPFYREFWGFNTHRVAAPVIVNEHPAGLCTLIESERAYFIHSNRGNPCTDVMLAFGDVLPGETAVARGRLWTSRGNARAVLAG